MALGCADLGCAELSPPARPADHSSRHQKPSNLKITPSGLIKLVDFGLVKILAPNEVTITIIQGQGTALYTPLEQYGGDDSHTDIRADIFSFGATLYHLVTNEPPTEARKRFLNSRSLTPPRDINPTLSSRVEKAILWAMSLHPDDRPKDVIELREALLGKKDTPDHVTSGRSGFDIPAFSLLPQEQLAAYTALGLFFDRLDRYSIKITLLHFRRGFSIILQNEQKSGGRRGLSTLGAGMDMPERFILFDE
ncbi:MAG: hypothetical protein IPO36_03375 [Anaerolineales bacterium]|nr:hypothetical protein [Anaerolineales bacterium]